MFSSQSVGVDFSSQVNAAVFCSKSDGVDFCSQSEGVDFYFCGLLWRSRAPPHWEVFHCRIRSHL